MQRSTKELASLFEKVIIFDIDELNNPLDMLFNHKNYRLNSRWIGTTLELTVDHDDEKFKKQLFHFLRNRMLLNEKLHAIPVKKIQGLEQGLSIPFGEHFPDITLWNTFKAILTCKEGWDSRDVQEITADSLKTSSTAAMMTALPAITSPMPIITPPPRPLPVAHDPEKNGFTHRLFAKFRTCFDTKPSQTTIPKPSKLMKP